MIKVITQDDHYHLLNLLSTFFDDVLSIPGGRDKGSFSKDERGHSRLNFNL